MFSAMASDAVSRRRSGSMKGAIITPRYAHLSKLYAHAQTHMCAHTHESCTRVHVYVQEDRDQLCAVIPRLITQNRKSEDFDTFSKWVDSTMRANGQYEFVLDGANIGFYGQVAFRL